MGNHDTRHAGVQERCEGTILFFSSNGCQAHIWCFSGPSPLCLAFETDFPELWPRLSVGMVVSVVIKEHGTVNRVADLALHAREPL
ncbi:MAG: hypothetical protein AAF965_03750 [Pseudomonadota bacterium]